MAQDNAGGSSWSVSPSTKWKRTPRNGGERAGVLRGLSDRRNAGPVR
jgi:hypothetical protein